MSTCTEALRDLSDAVDNLLVWAKTFEPHRMERSGWQRLDKSLLNARSVLQATSTSTPFVGARTDDPDTSAAAAESVAQREGSDVRIVTRDSCRHRLLVVYGRTTAAMLTDHEAAIRTAVRNTSQRPESIRRRCTDLRSAGYIEVVKEEKDPETGAVVFWCGITELGERVLLWLASNPTARRWSPT